MFNKVKNLQKKLQLNNIIQSWSLDYPSTKYGSRQKNGATLVQGWVLFKQDELNKNAELVVPVNSFIEKRVKLTEARPDVIKKKLTAEHKNHPQLYCGFRFTLPMHGCRLPIKLRVNNKEFVLDNITFPLPDSGSSVLKVLPGKEHWLLLDNDTNFSVDQHQGLLTLTNSALAAWQRYQTSLTAWSSSLKAPALLLAAPAKETVLPHYHPLPRAEVSPLEPVFKLFSPENLLYPVTELQALGDAAYYPTDTHWTHQAAACVAALVGRRMGLEQQAITSLLAQDRYAERLHTGGLGNKFEPPRCAPAMVLTSYSFRPCVVYDNALPNFGRLVVMCNASALCQGTLLVFGSSSSYSMFSTLCRLFGTVVFVHSAGSIDPELIQALSPDFMVAQTNSRFMIRPPETHFNTKAAIVSKKQELDSIALSAQQKNQVTNKLQQLKALNLLPWHEAL